MRKYYRPMILREAFEMDDIITESSNSESDIDTGDEASLLSAPHFFTEMNIDETTESAEGVSGVKSAPKMEVFGTVDAEGYFSQEISGGNPVQEGLNNLYENFLSKF